MGKCLSYCCCYLTVSFQPNFLITGDFQTVHLVKASPIADHPEDRPASQVKNPAYVEH